ncbi:MAG: YtxH domain-containing protein [Ignavibacteriae bacterium]|jgi:gas vesicle protein|nr:YtxH domain-containing protein [Ignavibacteriota bacterium]
MEENKMAKGLMIGFLAGGIVGSVIALLYAPKSGKELRSDIKLKKDEFIDDSTEYMKIAKSKAADLINDGKHKSEQLIKDARERAGTLLDDANSLLSDAKAKAGEKFGIAKEKINVESERIKDAFKAGIDAYKDEKTKDTI